MYCIDDIQCDFFLGPVSTSYYPHSQPTFYWDLGLVAKLSLGLASSIQESVLLENRHLVGIFVLFQCKRLARSTKECLARIVGISEQKGGAKTWLLLDDTTKKVVYRSNFHTALDPCTKNLCA
jgi:hypothetical protein